MRVSHIFHAHLMGEVVINDNPLFFSVNSVFSDETTSHSTKLAKGTSQVAGYVAKCFF